MEDNKELVEFLKGQIEVKDQQIEALNAALISIAQEKRSGSMVRIPDELFDNLFAFHCQNKQNDPELAQRIKRSLSKREQVIARERFYAQD